MPFSPIDPMNPNNRAAINRATRGGVPLQKAKEVVPIRWDAFVACGLIVRKDGKDQPAIFEPQITSITGFATTAEEVLQTLRLLLAAQRGKTGPLLWETVPPEVQRHFRFQQEDDQPAIETG